MAKNLKLKVKNTQLAKALNLGGIKKKIAKKTKGEKEEAKPVEEKAPVAETPPPEEVKKPSRVIRARSKSAFGPDAEEENKVEGPNAEAVVEKVEEHKEEEVAEETNEIPEEPFRAPRPRLAPKSRPSPTKTGKTQLGPTGKHVRDLIPPKPKAKPAQEPKPKEATGTADKKVDKPVKKPSEEGRSGDWNKYRDLKPKRKKLGGQGPGFDSRDKRGLRAGDDDGEAWRRRRVKRSRKEQDAPDLTIRPTELSVRLPITLKDLASEMKLKASQLIQKLFMQGVVVTINDILDDETTVQLLGEEFGCAISIDTTEEERIRVTGKSISEEISDAEDSHLETRPPVVTFMGHVDHGKTSLIDAIRLSNIASGEAGAITQHIGAFRCSTAVGDITVLDTPGHEAFSAMRARGADVTDIVVLVIAGDEGMRQQTIEAIDHAKAAGVTIMVALNKSDKPGFDPQKVYQQLSEQELLPEAWGGQTVCVNTSAVTKEGINELLEMLALQSEVLELRAMPGHRARGAVLESEMHKGFGNVATILVQNGTLRMGDALVFDECWGRVKTMINDRGERIEEAGPATPVEITGLSALPCSGDEFIVVESERDAKEIAEKRLEGKRARHLQLSSKPTSLEGLLQEVSENQKKVLKVILRADVQGSMEALRTALEKIESEKAEVQIISTGVGEISESDVTLAAASKAMVLGFHTQVESHAEPLIKQMAVQVRLHDIIYHAVDEIKDLLSGMLDRVESEEERGEAKVQATFKSSHLGVIAGCLVLEGMISRNHRVRVVREGEIVWRGKISSIKRVKDDVKEVKAGLECGIVLDGFNGVKEDDVLQAYEIVYLKQEL